MPPDTDGQCIGCKVRVYAMVKGTTKYNKTCSIFFTVVREAQCNRLLLH